MDIISLCKTLKDSELFLSNSKIDNPNAFGFKSIPIILLDFKSVYFSY